MTAGNGAAPDLRPLGQVIADHGLRPRKSLGQNFLLDPSITKRIASAAGELADTTVIEVGAGPGSLTRALLAQGAKLVVAIERDPRCIEALAELTAAYPDRLHVIEADALKLDLTALAPAPRAVIANLPYNVATPLLIEWLKCARDFTGFTLMFQKEVAARICAQPGGRDYGRLSIAAQWRCAARILFDVPPGAFIPPPKVTSTLISLVPREQPLAPAEWDVLERVTAAAFGQRRKMLRAALRQLGVDTETLLARAGVPPTVRAETVDIAGFCAIAREYACMNT
ncbi:MAG: 16S rRNA (adenine(1518)-N(6)/adenine(1519)-N(6))-dimethyltransferase RsmA [Alphaproteobacteria bacterium]|mgnify:CR=1 FL=1|jgi:16S rRNA (adenine1518-N6/adenine1519-N6)-dimethyltransferase